MSPYDYSGKRTGAGGKRGGARVLDIVAMTLTVMASLLLVLSYLSQCVSPEHAWPLALPGLVAPILYMICTILVLYWTIRWKRFLFVPLAAVLLGAGALPRFVKPALSKHHNQPSDREAFKILSYNVRGFIGIADNRSFSTAAEILSMADSVKPDIVCFQEFQTTPTANRQAIDDGLGYLPNRRISYKIQNRDGTGWGMAIYTRYPIINSGTIEFQKMANPAQWADIVIRRDTVRLFNVHLQSTLINSKDRDFIVNREFQTGHDTESHVRTIVSKLKRSYQARARQADTLATLIGQSPYDVMVCGDFNDTPMSYTYRTIRADMADSFVEKGRGLTTNTYRGLFNLFRIDYVLHSRSYEALWYETPQSDLSDHNPVIVVMKKVPPGTRD